MGLDDDKVVFQHTAVGQAVGQNMWRGCHRGSCGISLVPSGAT